MCVFEVLSVTQSFTVCLTPPLCAVVVSPCRQRSGQQVMGRDLTATWIKVTKTADQHAARFGSNTTKDSLSKTQVSLAAPDYFKIPEVQHPARQQANPWEYITRAPSKMESDPSRRTVREGLGCVWGRAIVKGHGQPVRVVCTDARRDVAGVPGVDDHQEQGTATPAQEALQGGEPWTSVPVRVIPVRVAELTVELTAPTPCSPTSGEEYEFRSRPHWSQADVVPPRPNTAQTFSRYLRDDFADEAKPKPAPTRAVPSLSPGMASASANPFVLTGRSSLLSPASSTGRSDASDGAFTGRNGGTGRGRVSITPAHVPRKGTVDGTVYGTAHDSGHWPFQLGAVVV